MAKIHVSRVVPASIERVWEYARDFNGLPKWFPGVTDSYIEPGVAVNQPGCVRNFGLEMERASANICWRSRTAIIRGITR